MLSGLEGEEEGYGFKGITSMEARNACGIAPIKLHLHEVWHLRV